MSQQPHHRIFLDHDEEADGGRGSLGDASGLILGGFGGGGIPHPPFSARIDPTRGERNASFGVEQGNPPEENEEEEEAPMMTKTTSRSHHHGGGNKTPRSHHRWRNRRTSATESIGALRPQIRKRSRRNLHGINVPPRNVHCSDWREMLELTNNVKPSGAEEHYEANGEETDTAKIVNKSVEDTMQQNAHQRVFETRSGQNSPEKSVYIRNRLISGGSTIHHDWIEQTFNRRECAVFIPTTKDNNKCGCGRYRHQHSTLALAAFNPLSESGRFYNRPHDGRHHEGKKGGGSKSVFPTRWGIKKHTVVEPTDSYGTIEFQGGPHPFKAQYLRLNFDTDPADIMCLFENVWKMPPPKLIITIHGGITNFDLQPKLARVFRKGLLKAARTTGAWIFTSGIDAGVVRQVAAALESAIPSSKAGRAKIVSVGIAPWGVLKRREELVGLDKVVSYHPQGFPLKSRFTVLNNRHSFFLLVDNGTVGRYGADIILRRRLESYIAQKQKIGGGTRSVPVVCVVLEGGTCTVRAVLDYVTTIPRVPVVVCDGSGRASDLIAFAHQYVNEDGNLPEGIRPQLLSLIEDVFFYNKNHAESLLMDILACVRQKNLITVFRLGGSQKQDVDYAILSALLKGQNLTPAEQLSLTLAWNRVDIARSDIFVMGQDWPKSVLYSAMLEALIQNRVDFVRLLLENGVSMHDFLTIGRLEELYNTDQGPPNTLYYIVRDVYRIKAGYRYRLPHIGLAIEKLMRNGFRSYYTSTQFKRKYGDYRTKVKEQQAQHQQAQQQQAQATAGDPSSKNQNRRNSDLFRAGGAGTQNLHMQKSPSATDALFAAGGGRTSEARGSFGRTGPSATASGRPPAYAGRHSASALQHPRPANNLVELVPPQISGSRALSNHILWRTAFRREHHHLANSPSTSQLTDPSHFGGKMVTMVDLDEEHLSDEGKHEPDFKYPFSDLLIWAVLTKRHDMALCMWSHGEEALAKALVACRLYKSLSNEAAEDYLEVEVCDELRKYADEFRQLALELVDHCYKQDDTKTLQLLTYELSHWGHETCLSLAVIVNHKQFLAHPCCQILLADLWHGGLRIRSNSNLKVIIGILFPPSIFFLEFKSREELMLQPQTAAEHQDDILSTSSSSESTSSSSSSASSSSDSESDSDNNKSDSGGGRQPPASADRRHISHSGSNQSIHLAAIFAGKRRCRRHKSSQNPNDIEVGRPDATSHRSHSHKTPVTSKPSIGGTPRPVLSPIGHPLSAPAAVVNRENEETSFTTVEDTKKGRFPLSGAKDATGAVRSAKRPGDNIVTANSVTVPTSPTFTIGEGDHRSSKDSSSNATVISDSPSINKPDRCLLGRSSNAFHQSQQNRQSMTNKKSSILMPQLKKLSNFHPLQHGVVPAGTEGITIGKKRQIKYKRKLYEFFVAPITTFWSWTLSFLLFLSALTFVLLVKTPPKPTWLEWYLFAYVVSFGLEILRKLFMSEPKKFREKFQYFYGNYWNIITTGAVAGFIFGFMLRIHPGTLVVGRIILAVDSVLWSVKLLDFLGVHAQFGPYITMAGKMVMNMSSIVIMLWISLLAFGLARQSITYPNEDWHWLLLRNVFYKPYFMLYGEVYADEIDSCGDEAWDKHLESGDPIDSIWSNNTDGKNSCVPGHWIPPLMMTFFLLVANILLISMLIAIFNNIFESTNKISQQIWLFQRYRQVMEYEATPFIPPPFTPVYHLYMVVKYVSYRRKTLQTCCRLWDSRKALRNLRNCFCSCLCCRRSSNSSGSKDRGGDHSKDSSGQTTAATNSPEHHGAGKQPHPPPPLSSTRSHAQQLQQQCNHIEKRALFDFSLKLFLTEDQIEKLHDFEEECMEDLAREKEYERSRTNEERLQKATERTELILLRLNDLTSKETSLKGNVHSLESRLELIESRQSEMLECMRQISSAIQQNFPPPPAAFLPSNQHSFEQQQRQIVAGSSSRRPSEIPPPSQLPLYDYHQRSRGVSQSSDANEYRSPRSPRFRVADEREEGGEESVDEKAALPTVSVYPFDTPKKRRASSYNSLGVQQQSGGEGGDSSTTTTIYCPLNSRDSGTSMERAGIRRSRTATVAGTETGSAITPSPIYLQVAGGGSKGGPMDEQSTITLSPTSPPQPHSYGSMLSLDNQHPHSTLNHPASFPGGKNSSFRRPWPRQHDEYTSITDGIDVLGMSTDGGQQRELGSLHRAAVDGDLPGHSSTTSAQTKNDNSVERGPKSKALKRREMTLDTETEEMGIEEEEEEEEIMDRTDEELDEEEDYESKEEDESKSGEGTRRRHQFNRDSAPEWKHRSQQHRPSAFQPRKVSANAELLGDSSFDAEDMPDMLFSGGGDEKAFSGVGGGGPHSLRRVDTPNTQLHRARNSFIMKQNTIYKNFEEHVGRPLASEKQQSPSELDPKTHQYNRNHPRLGSSDSSIREEAGISFSASGQKLKEQ